MSLERGERHAIRGCTEFWSEVMIGVIRECTETSQSSGSLMPLNQFVSDRESNGSGTTCQPELGEYG